MKLDQPVSEIKGVGVELRKKFALIGITTVEGLLQNYPRRYDDYSNVQVISQIKPGAVTIKAEVKQVTGRYVRRGLHITEAIASDKSGSVRLVWFNQPYRAAGLKSRVEYFISGQFELSHQKLAIMNPSAEMVSAFPLNAARIVPTYKEIKGLKSAQIRKIVKEVLQHIKLDETLPKWLVEIQGLLSRHHAVATMHFPDNMASLQKAQHRLGFEEVFQLTLTALLTKNELLHEKALVIPFDESLARKFVGHLPFTLTNAQRSVIWQIYKDLQKAHPMNRLIEGDVGSGKTVVATMASLMVMLKGFQVALMAPTEILARQHAETVYELLKPLNLDGCVGLLVGGLPAVQKQQAYQHISMGEVKFIIGTHALIQEPLNMHKLGLIIIDEQHRFGVEQRKKLQAKAGHMPHVLHMTATPIPRSLALTLFGELDISTIDAQPEGRKPIITTVCSPNSRSQLYSEIEKQLEAGRQMFVVCPLINDSSVMNDLSSAEAVYKRFKSRDFKNWKVGMLHGKMKSAEKTTIMEKFLKHELDILVATTVIEVGVNVPNATVMLIEDANRFGLAQIHQLRGRVGRSDQQGYCYLMMSDSAQPGQRLRALERSSDGFELAELDLELRGPGAIYGTLQHGQLDLRVAKLTDTKLIAAARKSAQLFIDKHENLLQYPHLSARVNKLRSITNLN